jgi:hypothetical protein
MRLANLVDSQTRYRMATTTITVDAALKARLAELARQAGQDVDQFAEALLRRFVDADIRVVRGVPAFPRRPGAPVVTVDDVDRLAGDSDE